MSTKRSAANTFRQANFKLPVHQHMTAERSACQTPCHNQSLTLCHILDSMKIDSVVILYVYKFLRAQRRAIRKIVIDALRKLPKVDRKHEVRERAQVVLGRVPGGWAA
jgi:hypothetical protein